MRSVWTGLAGGVVLGASGGVALELLTHPRDRVATRQEGERWLDDHRERTDAARRTDERRDERLAREVDAWVRANPMPGGGEAVRAPASWVEHYEPPPQRRWYLPTMVFGGIGAGLASLAPLALLERTNSERLSTHGLRGAAAFGPLTITPAFIAGALVTNALMDRR